MATVNMFFPGNVYPEAYSPPFLGVDYLPELGGFLDLTGLTIGASTATSQTISLANGLKFKILGSGFVYDADLRGIEGTVNSVQLLLIDGTTLQQSITGLNVLMEDLWNTAHNFNGFGINRWLLNGNDTLNGAAGESDLYGYGGDDILRAGTGGSYMVGSFGRDTYVGGTGFDVVSFDDSYYETLAFRGISLNAVNGTVIDCYGNTESFSGIEGFRGSRFADTIIGSTADEQFSGLGSRDSMNGGGGIDEVRYDRDSNFGGSKGVTVDLTGNFAIDGFGFRDTIFNMENVRGSNFNDTLTGNAVANRLRGFDGNDTIDGKAGGDDMRGGRGDDTYFIDNADDFVDELADDGDGIDTISTNLTMNLGKQDQIAGIVENLTLTGSLNANGTGNSQNNIIIGNVGSNILNGGAGGLDTITTGLGGDFIVFNTTLTPTNIDTITDFDPALDSFRIARTVFTDFTTAGTLSSGQFKNLDLGTVDSTDRILYDQDQGDLYYDADGSGNAFLAVKFAEIDNHATLTNKDFLII